jgi:hypothetical protein
LLHFIPLKLCDFWLLLLSIRRTNQKRQSLRCIKPPGLCREGLSAWSSLVSESIFLLAPPTGSGTSDLTTCACYSELHGAEWTHEIVVPNL